ncbi:ATP-grasp domain-containing protein [Glycomyces harbinensis]|uniref:ATP-grasp domain-containing protein n=1 Tax=Glycomyces harbinensis TaxID=58114 RepID=A0A1G7D2C8_9ACTN|nr:biotin carboxylase [Glycomyces harbinensis]SDE45708.1 hypothetical protein SAMN05216270_12278 [Glycomyces harbinensis]
MNTPASTYVDHGTGHVIVVHAWQDQYAHYDSYLDHSSRPVTYITNPTGRESIPDRAAEVVVLPRTTDPAELRRATYQLSERHGEPSAIIALKENHLPTVSRLREELGAAGPYAADLAPFLDKDLMTRLVESIGLPVPAYAPVSTNADIIEFGRRHGWPVVTKPLRGSASEGVSRVPGEDAAAELTWDRPIMVQRFQAGDIYHVDGYWTGSELGPWRMSRYVSSLFSFRHRQSPAGAVEVDDPGTLAAMDDYLQELIPGMCESAWVFHLEVFGDGNSTRPSEFVFLEVGRRVGGAEIPFLWREVHQVDLMAIECAIQTGNPVPRLDVADPGVMAGWLLCPVPARRPCRVTSSNSMMHIPAVYGERVLEPGAVIPDAEAFYEHVGGRFRFRAGSTKEVTDSIDSVIKEFHINCEPLPKERS